MIVRKLILIVFWLASFPGFSFASGNWDVHPTPLERLEAAGVATDVSSVSEVLLDRSRATQLRSLAASGLAQIADDATIPTLITAAGDLNSDVRTAAISALGFIPSDESIPVLRGVIHNDLIPQPRSAAIIALQMIGSDEAAHVLALAALNEYETQRNRISALNAMDQIGSADASSQLVPLVDSNNPNIRGKAALVLSRGIDSRYVDDLVSAALDSDLDPHVYIGVVERLEEISGRKLSQTPGEARSKSQSRIREWWPENPDK